MALASAPTGRSLNSHPLRTTANGRMAFSAGYLDFKINERTGFRPFTVGRKNWVNMDTIRGAETSAIIYSLVETAKVNNIKVYDYLELLLNRHF